MPRTLNLTTSLSGALNTVSPAIYVVRDETLQIVLSGSPGTVAMDIAASEGGTPLVEIPGTNSVLVTPNRISSLNEGETYKVDFWDLNDPVDPMRILKATIVIGNSIKPQSVTYPTQWLSGGSGSIVELSQAEYDALGTYDPTTIYVIV